MTPETIQSKERLTFTPLANRWYRFNETLQKTKHPKQFLWDYIKNKRNRVIKQQPQKLDISNITTVVLKYNNKWKCPCCGVKNHGGLFKSNVTCVSCGHRYFADKQESSQRNGHAPSVFSYSFDDF